MGNACTGSCPPPDYVILVKTGDHKGSGTNADVFVALYNEFDERSRDIPLDCRWKNDMERGSLDRYPVTNMPNFGCVSKIEVWRNSDGFGDSWFLERIEVRIFICNKQGRTIKRKEFGDGVGEGWDGRGRGG